MGLSVIAPFGPSWNRMVTVLFRPFDISRWFVIGCGAFLSQLGEGGGGSFNVGNWGGNGKGGGSGGIPQPLADAHAWILGHWGWILAGGAVVLPLLAALWGVFLWLSSRGHLILLDNLLRNRADIGGPWTEFRKEANSLFRWRFAFALLSFVVVWIPLLYGAWCLLDAWVKARDFTPECLMLAMQMAAWFIVAFLAAVPFILVLRDFVPVIQWHRRIGAGEAMKVFWREVLPGNFWSLNLYYLWLAVLWMGAAIVIFAGTCCTCCIAGLPYLSSVAFLPIFALFRLYPAYYLAQLGKGWELVEDGSGGPPPLPASGQTYAVTGVVTAQARDSSEPPPLPPAP